MEDKHPKAKTGQNWCPKQCKGESECWGKVILMSYGVFNKGLPLRGDLRFRMVSL